MPIVSGCLLFFDDRAMLLASMIRGSHNRTHTWGGDLIAVVAYGRQRMRRRRPALLLEASDDGACAEVCGSTMSLSTQEGPERTARSFGGQR